MTKLHKIIEKTEKEERERMISALQESGEIASKVK